MKDFSNETKNKRRKAILKVILKRYSFVVWVPTLLVLLNFIGIIVVKVNQILDPSVVPYLLGGMFDYYFTNILFGLSGCLILITGILLIVLIIKSLINYLKKGTIIEDFIEFLKAILKVLISIPIFIIRLPKKLFLRIKDEKRRFNNSLEKELGRNEND